MAKLDTLFRLVKNRNGSDLHISVGEVPRVRVYGSLVTVDGVEPLSARSVEELLRELVTPKQWETFLDTNELDFGYTAPGAARFRGNYFCDHKGAAAVFRIIPSEVATVDELDLPPAVGTFAHLSEGLLLVTGPTGSGKSTTLAAILHEINRAYAKHIITIEDPIEFIHSSQKSIFTQREIGTHADSFSDALRIAMRQDPDVILVGEMRDRETIGLALTAAEMGIFVLGTVHTNNVVKTIDRIMDAFDAEEQKHTRSMLAQSLAGIVSQFLVARVDKPGRIPVTEVLVRTSAVPNVIREGNTSLLVSIIQGGKKQGMSSMDDRLMSLLEKGVIAAEEAYIRAYDKTQFEHFLD